MYVPGAATMLVAIVAFAVHGAIPVRPIDMFIYCTIGARQDVLICSSTMFMGRWSRSGAYTTVVFPYNDCPTDTLFNATFLGAIKDCGVPVSVIG